MYGFWLDKRLGKNYENLTEICRQRKSTCVSPVIVAQKLLEIKYVDELNMDTHVGVPYLAEKFSLINKRNPLAPVVCAFRRHDWHVKEQRIFMSYCCSVNGVRLRKKHRCAISWPWCKTKPFKKIIDQMLCSLSLFLKWSARENLLAK